MLPKYLFVGRVLITFSTVLQYYVRAKPLWNGEMRVVARMFAHIEYN